MSELPTILITDDDDGHALLMEDNLGRPEVDSDVMIRLGRFVNLLQRPRFSNEFGPKQAQPW